MRSASMQTLTGEVMARHRRVTIYGIGDDDHKRSRSGHNEDDTPGSRPEEEDADRIPEHRAIDIMIGAAFTKADAYTLIGEILEHRHNRARLRYIIFDGWIWHRDNGFQAVPFDGDPHGDHIHLSGRAVDDDNTTPWLPDLVQKEHDMRGLLVNLTGRATVWYKAPNEPVRPLSHGWSIDALAAAGAVRVTAPNVAAMLEVVGVPAGNDAEQALARFRAG